MFKFIKEDDLGTVINERGVIISHSGRDNLKYQIGDKTVIFVCERAIGYESINIPKIINWELPFENEVVTEEEIEMIKTDILEALKVLCPNSEIEFIYE